MTAEFRQSHRACISSQPLSSNAKGGRFLTVFGNVTIRFPERTTPMTLNYLLLGNSGLRVSELSLGTMTFGEEWGWGSPKEESRKIYDAYREAGGNFIDTANLYTQGTSETFVGEFMRGHREQMVVATKYSNAAPGSDPNVAGNHRKNMMQSVEASLKRLGTDYIDLYWLHIWDGLTPVDEVMRAFDDL